MFTAYACSCACRIRVSGELLFAAERPILSGEVPPCHFVVLTTD